MSTKALLAEHSGYTARDKPDQASLSEQIFYCSDDPVTIMKAARKISILIGVMTMNICIGSSFAQEKKSKENKTAVMPGDVKTVGSTYLFNDSHFHLTNYIQEGITAKQLLSLMGDKVSRSTLFGIPL